MERLGELYVQFFGANSAVAPEYLLCFAFIAWIVFRIRRIKGNFWAWAFPRSMWFSKSSFVDLSLFLSNHFIALTGITARLTLTPVIAAFVATLIARDGEGLFDFSPLGLAFALFVVTDATTYFIHRFYHQSRAFWPLHAVHHSAAVLTPLTTYRQHPLAGLFSVVIQSSLVGVAFGVLVGSMDNSFSVAEFAGANLFSVAANVLVNHLHHSHIWISFGPFWERIFISPAQHQVHHSTERRHYDKNYGAILAVWDWMFGTLYVTQKDETVSFGLEGGEEEALMTQRLWPILWQPVIRFARLGKPPASRDLKTR